MKFMYNFEVGYKDGSTKKDEYPKGLEALDDVAYIKFSAKNMLCPPFFFFFTEGRMKLTRFFGKGFVTAGRGNDYFYCLFTDKFRCYINAYDGHVIFTDDLTYRIKSKHSRL